MKYRVTFYLSIIFFIQLLTTYLEGIEPTGKLELSQKALEPKGGGKKNYCKSHVAFLFLSTNYILIIFGYSVLLLFPWKTAALPGLQCRRDPRWPQGSRLKNHQLATQQSRAIQ